LAPKTAHFVAVFHLLLRLFIDIPAKSLRLRLDFLPTLDLFCSKLRLGCDKIPFFVGIKPEYRNTERKLAHNGKPATAKPVSPTAGGGGALL
jgi:hypothetical protein